LLPDYISPLALNAEGLFFCFFSSFSLCNILKKKTNKNVILQFT